MNLESDKRLNIQLRLDFPSAPSGEARQAGREDIESLSAVNDPERPANTSSIVLAQLLEPPCTDPYARWCGRGGAARLPPIPIICAKRTFVEKRTSARATTGSQLIYRSLRRRTNVGMVTILIREPIFRLGSCAAASTLYPA